MVQVAILTIIASIAITFFGLLAARRTKTIQKAEREKIPIRKVPVQSVPSGSDPVVSMASGGLINFGLGNSGNVSNTTGDRFAATSSSAR